MNIIILPGWGHTAQMWREFANKFSQNVYVFNLPGFGGEKLVSSNWGVADYAKWVTKKISKNKLKSVVLVGHSFGGKVAAEIAIGNPALVKKLILVSAPALRRPSFKTKARIFAHKLVKRVLLRKPSFPRFNKEYKDAIENEMGTIFKNSVNYDAGERLNKIKCPTLIIWGKEDRDAPVFIGKLMHKLIKHSRLEIIPKTGHNIYLENPNLLYGLITKFI